jgi:hypothetical protein
MLFWVLCPKSFHHTKLLLQFQLEQIQFLDSYFKLDIKELGFLKQSLDVLQAQVLYFLDHDGLAPHKQSTYGKHLGLLDGIYVLV